MWLCDTAATSSFCFVLDDQCLRTLMCFVESGSITGKLIHRNWSQPCFRSVAEAVYRAQYFENTRCCQWTEAFSVLASAQDVLAIDTVPTTKRSKLHCFASHQCSRPPDFSVNSELSQHATRYHFLSLPAQLYNGCKLFETPRL